MPAMVSGAAAGRVVVALALVGLFLLGLNDPGCAAERDEIVRVVSVEQLNHYYDRLDYTAEALAAGEITEVPRLRLERIPERWSEGISVADKKSVFYRTILPLILEVNERVLAERAQLLDLRTAIASGQETAARDILWLAGLAGRYGVWQRDPPPSGAERVIQWAEQEWQCLVKVDCGRVPPSPADFETLVRRVDAVPASLALAQAAYESGHATSRFATEGNALFGQWRWGHGLTPREQRSDRGEGLIPLTPV